LPEKGVIRFYGDNSNGKSVLVKGLWDILSNGISRPKYRRDLVRRGCSFGELTYTLHTGVSLFTHIHIDAAQTFTELRTPDEDPIRRYLSDKNIAELVNSFGIHFDTELKISINIHRDDDPLLFVSTPHKVNYQLADSAMSDTYAESALKTFDTLIPECKKEVKQLIGNVAITQASLDALTLYDIEKEEELLSKVTRYINLLEHCAVGLPPDIQPIPVFIPTIPALPKLVYTLPVINLQLPDLNETFESIISLEKGICPTCKRSF
jgi:hypothetical protein